MRNKSLWCSLIVCLCFIVGCGVAYAEDDSSFCCGTDPELMREMYSALMQKNLAEIDINNDSGNNQVKVRQIQIGPLYDSLMPSTGDVKVLVLPVEFSDCKFDESPYDVLEETFFEEQDVTDKNITSYSISTFYKIRSSNQLRLSGMVLPVHTVSDEWNNYYDMALHANSLYPNSMFVKEITKALQSYKGIIGDLSEYDSDGDGYIDCLQVQVPIESSKLGYAGLTTSAHNSKIYNNKLLSKYVVLAKERPGCGAHEIGHLMGLPDNYYGGDVRRCIIPYGCADLMSGAFGTNINAYYRYLLGWEEPLILSYADMIQGVTLCASDRYSDQNDQVCSIMFAIIDENNPTKLPFGEFYIAEYRAKTNFMNVGPGIIIWHINLKKLAGLGVPVGVESTDYIVPVFKGGTTFTSSDFPQYAEQDIYITGDEWSADTKPSSDFYNDRYTGAYMKVLSMDDEKAVIQAGYKEPDISPAPVVTLEPATSHYINSNGEARWYYSVSNYDELNAPSRNDIKTGTVKDYVGGHHPAEHYIAVSKPKGDGTIQVEIKPGMARKGFSYSESVLSDIVIVDNTAPVITLNGSGTIGVVRGTEYVELGATVTDNLDRDVQNSLTINPSSVNLNKVGSYTVTYSAIDQAGNIVYAYRTVQVVEKPYTITLVANGGMLDNRLITYTQGTEIVLPVPTRAGYIFGGWYDNERYSGGRYIKILPKNTGDKTFYAKWTECSHTQCNEEVTSAPTCAAEGQKRITCKTCNSVWTEPIDRLPHIEVTDSAVEPTCETAGKTEGTHCGVCNTVIAAQTTIPALGHKYTADWQNDEADHWHKCERCDSTDGLAAHTEDSGIVTKPPTLEAVGEKTFCCSVCGYAMRTEEIPRLEPEHTHEYGAEWKSDIDGHWHECSCGERSEQSGHIPVADNAIEATCETAGKTAGSHCEICAYIITPQTTITALGHSYSSEWINDGTNHWHKCERCESIDGLAAHIEDSGTVTKPPTLEAVGEKTFCCSVCGYAMRTEEIPRLEPEHTHEYGAEWKSDIDGHWHECSCGERSEQSGHSYGEWVVIKKATAKAKGSKERLCTVCGYKQTQEIPAASSSGSSGGGGGGGGSVSNAKPEPAPVKPVEPKPEESVKQAMPFVDVKADDWFYEAVQYSYANGLMNGEAGNRFNPNNKLNRAMLVTILHRLEKEPNEKASSFIDVADNQYYAKAVAWASANGIVKGYEGGTFRPLSNISREEFAAVLMRYAEFKKLDVSRTADLSGYADAAKISAWAKQDMEWSNAVGLIKGDKDKTLNPQGEATRSEAATILMRFCENILE